MNSTGEVLDRPTHPKGFEHVRSGSSKELFRDDDESLIFQFTDHFSVFDVGRSEDTIPGKGEAICRAAVKSFKIAEAVGVPTCFIEQIDETSIRVHKANIITDRDLMPNDENYLVPGEWIRRHYVAGSLHRAFVSGEEKPENYGLPANVVPQVGTPLPWPVHQLTTKFEAVDRKMSADELCRKGGLTPKDMEEYWSMNDCLSGAIMLVMRRAGFFNLDGKTEMIMGFGRMKMVGDVVATQDEDRPSKITNGKVIYYNKEYLRQILIEMGYKKVLDEARKLGQPVPPIPRLTDEQIAEVSWRYNAFADAYVNV